jgi:hypothetical protein
VPEPGGMGRLDGLVRHGSGLATEIDGRPIL